MTSSPRSSPRPSIGSIALQRLSLDPLPRDHRAEHQLSVTIYVTLAVIIAFGVVYNSARIQLSEQARELASLRVLGFTRGGGLTRAVHRADPAHAVAMPLGWVIGYGFGWLADQGVLERPLPRAVRHRERNLCQGDASSCSRRPRLPPSSSADGSTGST